MALNWTMLNQNGKPIPLPKEMSITTIDSGVDLSLIIPQSSGSSSSSSVAGSAGSTKRKAIGKAYLTDQRFIFTSDPPNSSFESLSVPLHSILLTRFEQPTFGANFLTFEVKPSPDGGLTDGTQVELRFKDKAMFEFVSLLEKARERAIYMKRQLTEDEEGLPTYTMPAESSSVSMVGGVPVENPPSYD